MGVLWPGVNPNNAARGRWIGKDKTDSSSATTKTCPKCGVATERDGYYTIYKIYRKLWLNV